jgi:hypothetical protein
MLFLLAFACGKANPQADAKKAQPTVPVAEIVVAKQTSEADKAPSQDQLQCATLVATYHAERNRLFAGDRATLRERLSKVGEQFRAQMKEIPGCDFPVP